MDGAKFLVIHFICFHSLTVFQAFHGMLVLARSQVHEVISSNAPQQIHISYGYSPEEMTITWNTMSPAGTTVWYGSRGLDRSANGTQTSFRDAIIGKRVQYVHRVRLTGLTPGSTYTYVVGGPEARSKPYKFRAMRSGTDWSPRLVAYGDFGLINAQSLPRLMEDNRKGMYDAVLHVGDFAYDMYVNESRCGDEFMRMIEPLAATLPYMTCPGNHEAPFDFLNYKKRFSMPGKHENMLYSFNMGPAHIIAVSTEWYFFWKFGFWQFIEQYEWLKKDLKEANLPENRAKRPWIITMGHRPMYCSNTDRDDCTKFESRVRTGVSFLNMDGLEKLFYEAGVDLELWAHEHSYERLWPVYDRRVYNGSAAQPYTNPGAPVHIITGSAGCQERHDNFRNDTPAWSAFRSRDYGYTRIQIKNSSHLYLEQVSDDKRGDIIDSIWLIKDKHGPYSKL